MIPLQTIFLFRRTEKNGKFHVIIHTEKMVAKRRSARTKPPSPQVKISDSLVCIYCRERVAFAGSLPAIEYEKHMSRSILINIPINNINFCAITELSHNVNYEMESIIDRTLLLQRPNMLLERRVDAEIQCDVQNIEIIKKPNKNIEKHAAKNVELPPVKNEIAKRTRKVETMPTDKIEVPVTPTKPSIKKSNDKLIEVTEKRKLPWFAGCEYRCQHEDCGELFFYNQDLRQHIKQKHGDPDDYLDKFKVFETKDDYITCKECFLNLKRHYSSVFLHLREKHNSMSLQDYAKKHKMKDYDKTYKVKKRIKEEPQEQLSTAATPPPPQKSGGMRKRNSTASSPAPLVSTPTPPPPKSTVSRKRGGSVSPAPSTSSAPTPPPPKTTRKRGRTSTASPTPTMIEIKKIKIERPDTPEAPKVEKNVPSSVVPKVVPKVEPVKVEPKVEITEKPWFAGCEYACKICAEMHYSLNELLFHVRQAHNMTGKPYQRRFSKFETKKYLYECKLCFSKVKHNKTSIQSHLNANHEKMSLAYYEEVFHPDEKSARNEKVTEVKTPNKFRQNNIDDRFRTWAKGTCTFQCKICKYTTGGSVDFWKHVKNQHCIEIQAYKEQCGNPCIVMNKITCLACSRLLRYDYGTLLGHASTRHNMNLIEYYNKFFRQSVENPSPEKNKELDKAIQDVPSMKGKQASGLRKKAHMWGWRCRYKCNICKRSFSTRVGIQKHINLAHKLSVAEYSSLHGDTMTKKEYHRCRICQNRVLHDPSAIAQHTRMIHKITFEQYFSDYIEGQVVPLLPLVNKKPAVAKPLLKKPLIQKPKKKVSTFSGVKDRGEHVKWAHNAADYECKICRFTSNIKNTFMFHIKAKHGFNIDVYRNRYGPISDFERRHECKLCKAAIIWHKSNIGQHLNSVHSISLKDYYYRHIKNDHQSLPPLATSLDVDPPTSSDPSRWMNQCIFECKICSLKLDSRANFKGHVTNIHSTPYDNYINDFGEPMIALNLHCCLMCQESVTCDGEDITEHLNTAHALSLEDYHDRYIANDRTVATAKKPNTLCRNWNHQAQIHNCLVCNEPIQFAKDILEVHMKSHGIDLRIYEKRYRHQLDLIFEAFNDAENDPDDDDDFGSVFEDDGEEEAGMLSEEIDPFLNLTAQENVIQSPEDIDDIDIEENVDYITSDAL